jgi:ABC-type dipeptide/oligopeptide/nickel transport system permease subunit
VKVEEKAYTRRGASQWAVAWRRFRRNKSGLVGMAIVGFFAFVAIYGLFLSTYPPRSYACLYQGCTNLAPFSDWGHPLGTEPSGIDVFNEIIHGTAGDLYVGVAATAISIVIGVVIGAVAGYRGGASGALLLGVTQIFFTIPFLIVILLLARIFILLVAQGLGLTLIMLILGFFGWPTIAFVVRGEIFRIKELEFIQASRALGAGTTRILFRHIIPNVLSPIIVIASLTVAANILTEVVISFLGFGDVSASTWGLILEEGFMFVRSSWWVSLFPGIAVVFCVLGFNLLGDGLSDALNPRLRE